jgi:hypothetical protein
MDIAEFFQRLTIVLALTLPGLRFCLWIMKKVSPDVSSPAVTDQL